MSGQPSLAAQALAEFITGVGDIRNTQYVSFVTATIVIYDYIICIEREVELIWKKRWSVIKFAFLWHRYFGLLCVILQVYALNPREINDQLVGCDSETGLRPGSCSFWFYWETWGYCAVLFTTEAVLLLWIYVVYNKNRFILAIMGVCYIAEVAGVLTILSVSFQHLEAVAFGVLGAQYCVMGRLPKIFELLWVPILAYDTLLLLLFIYRGCRSTLACNRKTTYGHDNLLDMVYKHSLLNFLAIFGTYMACAIIWLTGRISLYQIPVGFALALSLTNCTRLLLNIRRAYYSGSGDPLLFNIRDIPATGANTPNMLEVPVSLALPPLSHATSSSALSASSTLRELSTTPAGGPLRGPSPNTNARRISVATTSSDVLMQVAPRPHPHLHEGVIGGSPGPSAVYVTPDLDPDMWQYELREMRVDPGVGEAF
ncbi:hypothetical protein C8Q78DRAFT_1075156 [Trametes maxima]|nr:hypothetical protein C8Q78DRAFT_1075156 [Trametes maxima]